jgi:hypothetical protein
LSHPGLAPCLHPMNESIEEYSTVNQILKPSVDATIIWNPIDSSQLKVGLERTLRASATTCS